MKLLTHKQVAKAPELGCCVAMGTEDAVVGYLHAANSVLGASPPPDLRTYPAFEGFVNVEALTSDGEAFLMLMEGK